MRVCASSMGVAARVAPSSFPVSILLSVFSKKTHFSEKQKHVCLKKKHIYI